MMGRVATPLRIAFAGLLPCAGLGCGGQAAPAPVSRSSINVPAGVALTGAEDQQGTRFTATIPDSEPPLLDRERFDRIREGMAVEDVVALFDGKVPKIELGGPRESYTVAFQQAGRWISVEYKVTDRGPVVSKKSAKGLE